MMARSEKTMQPAVYWPGRLSALIPLLLFAWIASRMPQIWRGERLLFSLEWVPSLDVNVSFALDGLSALFALIITGIGALVVIYADGYMAGQARLGRFYFYLHTFQLAMLGLVLCDNLVLLYVFWELTTIFSFLLIGFDHESGVSRVNARQALLVTGAGGLLLLTGILLTGQVTGGYGIAALASQGGVPRGHALYIPILLCVLAGAFTKSAQVPLHFWLPNAMTAPTPISAYLHSATMVKAGIYLLARLHPVLGDTQAWMTILVLVGAATTVWGSLLAMGQSDLKRMMAFTTIMALGIATMFLGGRSTPALTAAVTFVLVHALYKSALFMVVGNIDHQLGTRQLDQIGGIGRFMPATAAAAAMAALSMAGFPLFLGFIGKEIMYKGALTEDVFPELATAAALFGNSLMTAIAGTVMLRPFWGRRRGGQPPSEAPWRMWFGPLLLSGIGLGFGLIPDIVGRRLIAPAVEAFNPTTATIALKLFYGFNEPLLLSITTLTLGGALYLLRRRIRAAVGRLSAALPAGMADLFENLLTGIVWLAGRSTAFLQNGSLFRYLTITILTIVCAVGWALARAAVEAPSWATLKMNLLNLTLWQILLLALMLFSVAVALRSASRLLSICALGAVGAGIAVIFLSYGAPDLALTQLLVETLTLVIAAVVLLRLPGVVAGSRPDPLRRGLRLAASLGGGVLTALLLLSVGQFELDRTISDFYEQFSYVKAHGRNIVNVILVDFRGLDTLGEIIVVAASALGALGLIRKRRPPA